MLSVIGNRAVSALLAIPADFSCFSSFPRGMMGGMWGFGAFGMVFMVLFWGLLIFLFVWGITRLTVGQKGSISDSHESSLEILKRRLASGEITDEEYEKTRKKIV